MNDVLLIGIWDWANTGWRFARCLEYLGLKVKAFKGHPHIFRYPQEIDCHKALARTRHINGFPVIAHAPELRSWADNSKVIHYIASTFIDTGADLNGKPVVVQHSGVSYQLEPEKANAVFNPLVTHTIMQFPSLMGYGATGEELIYYPVDTAHIRPVYTRKSDRLIIGHFPSNPVTKGTDKVLRVIERLESSKWADRFEYVGIREVKPEHVSWEENLRRVSECDVLIETIQPWVYLGDGPGKYTFEPNGHKRPFGDWGNQALEGAALGKIVVTNFCHSALYYQEYGDCALRVANDESELENQLLFLLESSDRDILFMKQQSRLWAERNHSIESTALRLYERVYRNLM